MQAAVTSGPGTTGATRSAVETGLDGGADAQTKAGDKQVRVYGIPLFNLNKNEKYLLVPNESAPLAQIRLSDSYNRKFTRNNF